ncbi:MAG: dihydroorotate dehydrogenase [Phycisphaeraceae bacterium]|nr:dihydroorotate dehydrogenase [Phycisphaeraceae bacterium]MCW5753929.1 dihydroorotate dehydrogenase [Phycisphaeraceae bacterium]
MLSGMDDPALAVDLAGIGLRHPVLLAAGTAGTLDELSDVLDLSRVGGVVTKSMTREPRSGNATWRILPERSGMLNAIGLANMGIDAFVREVGPRVATMPCAVVGSVAGFSVAEYVEVAAAMEGVTALAGVELNVSCPNVHGGVEFGVDVAALSEVVREVRAVVKSKRLFVKLSPVAVGQPGIVALARAAIEPGGPCGGPNSRPGADVLCLCNTMPAMAIDVERRRPKLSNRTGGLSGPAVHPVTLKIVHDVWRGVAKSTGTAIVGIGGVLRWEDAAAYVLAGASAVGMGTGLFADPRSPVKVGAGLRKWIGRQGKRGLGELVGALEEPEVLAGA